MIIWILLDKPGPITFQHNKPCLFIIILSLCDQYNFNSLPWAEMSFQSGLSSVSFNAIKPLMIGSSLASLILSRLNLLSLSHEMLASIVTSWSVAPVGVSSSSSVFLDRFRFSFFPWMTCFSLSCCWLFLFLLDLGFLFLYLLSLLFISFLLQSGDHSQIHCSSPHCPQGYLDIASALPCLLPALCSMLNVYVSRTFSLLAIWPWGSLKFKKYFKAPWSVLIRNFFPNK